MLRHAPEADKDGVYRQECLVRGIVRGSGDQPIGHPGPARAAPEPGLTIRQEVSTATKSRAGMFLSSETRPDGHCGKAAPPKYQFEPLSARISP